MSNVRALLLGLIATAALGAAAHAADAPDAWYPGPYVRPAPRTIEMVSGWYLRGDAGYRLNHVSSFQAPAATITNVKYTDSVGLTFGAGYKYQWFRADLTIDYGPKVGTSATSTSGASQPQFTMKVATLTTLANLYMDLGTWWGFTPYIGGGAGVSYLQGRNYNDTSLVINQAVTSDRTTFSWAAMAGVSYRINTRFIVDLGYRHLNLGDIPSSTGSNLPSDRTRWQGLSTDEVRLGVRFMLD
jgi:opacity protein-like surface antigen